MLWILFELLPFTDVLLSKCQGNEEDEVEQILGEVVEALEAVAFLHSTL